MRISTPLNQIKLTNVSVVRLKKGGKRFEIACYKNKVLEWRNGIETDIENVVQIHQIFMNVSKGQVASQEDLNKCFKTVEIDKCLIEILKKGELQVGEKERTAQLTTNRKDIATIISSKCVNPESNRPYTVSMIEKAMADLHYSINPNKNSKQQALEIIKLLQSENILPIAPAQMRLRLVLPSKDGKRLKEKILTLIGSVEEEDWSEEYELICLIDPGKFREVSALIEEETKGKGNLEVLSVRETFQGDESLN
ncbi:hypothetical protein HDU92_001824 [Lobulomyces angularis]|nr:hypothetical protein HDU92_001824 [Lobulomyces angularis]